jgi:hypothetical protein
MNGKVSVERRRFGKGRLETRRRKKRESAAKNASAGERTALAAMKNVAVGYCRAVMVDETT